MVAGQGEHGGHDGHTDGQGVAGDPDGQGEGDALGNNEESGLDGRVVEHLEGGELTVTIWLGTRGETRLREVA